VEIPDLEVGIIREVEGFKMKLLLRLFKFERVDSIEAKFDSCEETDSMVDLRFSEVGPAVSTDHICGEEYGV
jgi:hypothetical protein